MRVRGLQTYLTGQKLVNSEPIDRLRDLKIGVDAVYWLRTLPSLKDPLADAIGGVAPGVYDVLDNGLALLKQFAINMLFVSQGIQPPSHMLFSSTLHQQMYEGWKHVGREEYHQAQQRFALATSRITSDFMFIVSRSLRSHGCELIQAPYLAAAQLAYFAQKGLVDAVFGPPALLLFGIPRVITAINFEKKTFEWVDLNQLLTAWNATEDQLIDACLLAGTEFCLTLPYLNLSQFHGGSQQFYFGTAVDFIKQAPLIGYLKHLPEDTVHLDHIDGYCVCKSLIKYPLALHLDGTVRPVRRRPIMPAAMPNSNTFALKENLADDLPIAVPDDFHKIVGFKLPRSLCFLVARRFLNRKLPSVLALGEWLERSYPTVDTIEYRELFNEIVGYRLRALGLIASCLHESFQQRKIKFAPPSSGAEGKRGVPNCRPGMAWNFTLDQLLNEMKRQQVSKCSFKFCLTWHAYETSLNRTLVELQPEGHSERGSVKYEGPLADVSDIRVFEAVVYFMLLENMGYFTVDGRDTVFGSAVATASAEFDENVLFALELMKCGDLTGDSLGSLKDLPFPEEVKVLRRKENAPMQKHILLLSRVVSLIPLKLKKTTALWVAAVDFDLAAFHSIVRVLKKTCRHLSEACVAHLLLKDLRRVRVIPDAELSLESSRFPYFMIPRNCLGIVFKHFLEFRHESGTKRFDGNSNPMARRFRRLQSELSMCYRNALDPIRDIFEGIRFWMEVGRVIDLLEQSIEVSSFKVEMDEAHQYLLTRIAETGLYLSPVMHEKRFEPLYSQVIPYIKKVTDIKENSTVPHPLRSITQSSASCPSEPGFLPPTTATGNFVQSPLEPPASAETDKMSAASNDGTVVAVPTGTTT